MNAKSIIEQAERDVAEIFSHIQEIEFENQQRVLTAFSKNRVSTRLFAPSYGYGYDDIGRDTFERVFA
ncbi:MAG: hypothetical protein GX802_06015, partial [Clostridiales bacterium]|nr:hypothetical protein [Clostridiales bacterium]